MLYTHQISFDLSKQESRKRIPVVFGSKDTVGVEITLKNGVQPWIFPAGTSCVIRFMKPNGNGGVYHSLSDGTEAWSVEENRITVLMAPEALDVPGLVDVSVVAVNNGQTLGIYGFDIHIDCNVFLERNETGDLLEFTTLSEINTGFAVLQMKTELDSTLTMAARPAEAAAVGAALAGKAPAGFGLGSVATYVDDFNNAAACGWYYGINAANSPLGDLVLLEVFSHVVTSWVVQKAYYMNANNEWHTMCVRYNKNGAWTEWEWINPPMMFGVEYRTTERRNGAPVYARAIDGGVSVAGDNTTVVSDIVGATIIRCDTTVGKMSGDFIANGDAANDWTVHTRYEGVHIYTWCGGSRTGLSIQHRIWYTK